MSLAHFHKGGLNKSVDHSYNQSVTLKQSLNTLNYFLSESEVRRWISTPCLCVKYGAINPGGN